MRQAALRVSQALLIFMVAHWVMAGFLADPFPFPSADMTYTAHSSYKSATGRANTPGDEGFTGQPISSPRISHALTAAAVYWARQGRNKDCPGGARTFFKPVISDPEVPEGYEIRAHAVMDGCQIEYSHKTIYAEGWREFCEMTVHEYGHLLGLPHSKDRTSVMYWEVGTPEMERIPECDSVSDARRFGPPIDTRARLCRFLIDNRLTGLDIGEARNCDRIITASVGSDWTKGLRPSTCQDVETVALPRNEYTSHWDVRVFNPQGCRVVDVAYLGGRKTKVVDFPLDKQYLRPYTKGD